MNEATSAPENPMLTRATAQLVTAANTIAVMHGLNSAECETMMCNALLYAVASHAIPGAENRVLSILVQYLRDRLPIAMDDVAKQRLARTAGTA